MDHDRIRRLWDRLRRCSGFRFHGSGLSLDPPVPVCLAELAVCESGQWVPSVLAILDDDGAKGLAMEWLGLDLDRASALFQGGTGADMFRTPPDAEETAVTLDRLRVTGEVDYAAARAFVRDRDSRTVEPALDI